MAKDKVNVRSKMLGGQSWISLLVKDAKGRGWGKNQKPRIRASKATEVKSCPFIPQILSISNKLGTIQVLGHRGEQTMSIEGWRLPLGMLTRASILKVLWMYLLAFTSCWIRSKFCKCLFVGPTFELQLVSVARYKRQAKPWCDWCFWCFDYYCGGRTGKAWTVLMGLVKVNWLNMEL